MKRTLSSLAFVVVTLFMFAPVCAAGDTKSLLKESGYALPLELKFSKKDQNPLQRVLSFLEMGPNGYATGFLVDDDLMITAYHVVSGDLSVSKKAQLGFGAKDELEVKVYVGGCQATVLKVDADADLALLRVCRSSRQIEFPVFQSSLSKDEKLLLIARPHGGKMVRQGVFFGPYMTRGLEYWSAKLDGRDGYSGSPVYNDKAELVGVFSGYDWSRKLAVISPGARAQKLLEDYLHSSKP
ncbi:MAG: trypsin-like peptidase domain-containing protein [Pyrinomonadaceae bacterium]|nr:trypsin-like peptidase domain-containing protein [Pyrinomonadaceae bacterium]